MFIAYSWPETCILNSDVFLRCLVSAPVIQVLVAGPVRSVELCSGVIQKSSVMVSIKMCLTLHLSVYLSSHLDHWSSTCFIWLCNCLSFLCIRHYSRLRKTKKFGRIYIKSIYIYILNIQINTLPSAHYEALPLLSWTHVAKLTTLTVTPPAPPLLLVLVCPPVVNWLE